MTQTQIRRNARRVLKDIGETKVWAMTVSELKKACQYHLRAVENGYESRLAKDEIETLKAVAK